MADPRLASAMTRLSRALERLEARADAQRSLAGRHAALKEATADSLTMLDRLIAAERA